MKKLSISNRRLKWKRVHRLKSYAPHVHFCHPIVRSSEVFTIRVVLKDPDVRGDIS